MTDAVRSRAWLAALIIGVPAAGAAVACTAGDALVYSGAGSSDGGLDGASDGGVTADGALLTPPAQNDGGFVPSLRQLACSGLAVDAGCDPSAGMGCCLAASSDMTGSDNACLDQAQHYSSSGCKSDGDVFLGCLSSNPDSTCCWQPEGNRRMDTRFRTDCDGGVEACDPTADGGSCATGGACTPATCKGVVVGYCGGGAPPCQP